MNNCMVLVNGHVVIAFRSCINLIGLLWKIPINLSTTLCHDESNAAGLVSKLAVAPPKQNGAEPTSIAHITILPGGTYNESVTQINNGDGVIGNQDKTVGITPAEMIQLFEKVYSMAAVRPNTTADDRLRLQSEIRQVENEIGKGDKADRGFIEERLANIGRMAPDILEVFVATAVNPIAGFALIAKKVSDKAKSSL